tara:strand:- start:1946 stop:5179 length:3234 start_codon:yes stop_codon:yes gene_type:complete
MSKKKNTKKVLENLKAKRSQFAAGGYGYGSSRKKAPAIPANETVSKPKPKNAPQGMDSITAMPTGPRKAEGTRQPIEQRKEIAAWQESTQRAMESDKYSALLKRNQDSKGQDKEALAELERIKKTFEDSRPNLNFDKEPQQTVYNEDAGQDFNVEGTGEIPDFTLTDTEGAEAGLDRWWEGEGYDTLDDAIDDGWEFVDGNWSNNGVGLDAPGSGYGNPPGGTPPPTGNPETDDNTGGGNATQVGTGAPTNIKQNNPDYAIPEMEAAKLGSEMFRTGAYGSTTGKEDIQSIGKAKKVSSGYGVSSTKMNVGQQDDVIKVGKPATVAGGSFTADTLGGGAEVEAAQLDDLRPEAIAELDDATLTERAVAAQRDPAQEDAALQEEARKLRAQRDAYVPRVLGDTAKVSETARAEESDRELILGKDVAKGKAAQILGTAGFDAASRRTVTGKAAKNSAAKMVEEIGDLPPDISAAIVEDPATVTAQIDSAPVEVQAAVAALPTEALVSSQMESLLGGMEDGEIPMWARPAVQNVNDMLTRRGLTSSSVGRDALFNSIIQSAMPMAQSNAQALQTRAAQNLSNEQQANIAQSTQSMQMRLANLANRQTSESQTAQMSQQMKTMQSQFTQDSVMTSAQFQQQTRTQNLANRQERAKTDAQNDAAMRAQNLGNEQQVELARMQYENATESENMSAEQQERMAEFQVAADFMSKNEGFVQQMELANLSNRQQMELANLTSKNQQESELMSNDQQVELANLNARMQTNLTQAKIAESMNLAQLSSDQQRAVQNASMVANIDLTQFSADQQVQIANSKFMQTMTLSDFNAEQQAAMQNATALASLDMANLDKNTKLAAQNAQAFLQLDMTNLSNEQQANMMRSQNNQQAMLSDQAAQNAAMQFAAASQQQADQFMAGLNVQVEQYNSSAAAAQSQFNASEANKMASIQAGNDLQAAQFNTQMSIDVDKFNEQADFQRDQWNASNAQAVEQSNVQWRRQANLQNTAAQNAANQQNAQIAYNMSSQEQTQLWQQLRDETAYIRQNYENEQQRKAQMIATAIGNESVFKKVGDTSNFINTLEAALGSVG